MVNEANETLGTIDDLIVTPGGQAPYAVLSVGGFLGMGTKYAVVPFTSLEVIDKKMVLPGGTKDALKTLPDFKYATWLIGSETPPLWQAGGGHPMHLAHQHALMQG